MTMKYASVTRCQTLEQENAELRAEVERLKRERQWVPVTERKPETIHDVWVWNGKEVRRDSWTGRKWCLPGRDLVTHWQPIFKPEPPQPDAASGASGTGEGEV